MPGYPNLEELDELWPDQGYAIIIEDELKPPDSEDFVNVLQKFDKPDFELPSPKDGYSYWVHDADGTSYTREEWREYKKRHSKNK